MDSFVLSSPKVISKVSKFYENFEFTPIQDLVEKSNQENFKIKFILMSVLPQDAKEFCRLFCKVCKKSYSFKNLMTEANSDFETLCPNCNSLSSPVWQMTFVVKDALAFDSQNFFKIHYYTHFQNVYLGFEDSIQPETSIDDPSKIEYFFGGQKPTNLYQDEEGLNKIEKYLQIMKKFNVQVDAVVQRKVLGQKQIFTLHDAQLI